MDAGKDDGIFTQIKRSLRSASWLGQVPWVYHVHQFLLPVIRNHLAVNLCSTGIIDYTVQAIEDQKDRTIERLDMLGMLFKVQESKASDFSTADITSIASSNIGAGSDTTVVSLRAIIYHLLKNPRCKTKLIEEIEQVLKGAELPKVVSFDDSKKMPYLQAVFHEALRLHPAVGMNLPRKTPSGG